MAFANTAGGILLIGVEDRSRNVRGVAHPLDEEERLANLISDRISPRLAPEIEILLWRQMQVLVVQVYPSPSRPHHLIREGPAAGLYVRVGSTSNLFRASARKPSTSERLPSRLHPSAPSAAATWRPCGSWAPTWGGRCQPWAA